MRNAKKWTAILLAAAMAAGSVPVSAGSMEVEYPVDCDEVLLPDVEEELTGNVGLEETVVQPGLAEEEPEEIEEVVDETVKEEDELPEDTAVGEELLLENDPQEEPVAADAGWTEVTGTEEDLFVPIEGETSLLAASPHSHNGTDFTQWDSTSSLPQSGNYYLSGDVTLDAAWIVDGTVHLCLNGHKISGHAASGLIIVNGALSVYDEGNGSISNTGGTAIVVTGGSLSMHGGTIKDSGGQEAYSGGVSVTGGAFAMHDGVTIANNRGTYGGGVYLYQGSEFTMDGGTIRDNRAEYGGGVYMNGSSMTLDGGTIENNAAKFHGGVTVWDNSTMTIHSGQVKNNSADKITGGISVLRSTLNFSSGEISGNRSEKDGGLTALSSTINLSGDPVIAGNTENGAPSNVCLDGGQVFTMTGEYEGRIGVRMRRQNPSGTVEKDMGEFTTGLPGKGVYTSFVSDDPDYIVVKTPSGEAALHQHDTTHTVIAEDTLKSICANRDCFLKDGENIMTISAESGTYDGTAYPAVLSGNAEFNELMGTNYTDSSIEYYKDGKKIAAAPVETGEYTAVLPVMIGGKDYSIKTKITISDASLDVHAAAYENVYDGQPHSISVTASEGSVISYSLDKDGTYSTTPIQKKDVGKYLIYYKVEKANFAPVTGSKTITITPKTVTVSGIKAKNKVYDGNTDVELEFRDAVVNGRAGNDNLLVTAIGEFADAHAGTGKKVPIRRLALSGDGVGNYTLDSANSQKEATAAITPKEVGLAWTNTSLTYNGQDQIPSVEATGLIARDKCTVTTTGAARDASAAPYSATAIALSNSDYMLPASTRTDFTISKAPVAVKADAKNKVYGQTDPALTWTANGLFGTDTITGKLEREPGENTGVYAIKQGTLTAGNNYRIIYTQDFLTIKKTQNAVRAEITGWTYDGKAHDNAKLSSTYGKPYAVYSSHRDGPYTKTIPTQAGTWYVKGVADETDDYAKAESAPVAFKIAKANITITAEDKDSIYGKELQPLTYKISGSYVAGDKLNVVLSTRADKTTNAGVYPITIAWKNSNYNAKLVTGKYTIEKADLAVKSNGYSGTYDGKAHGITVNTGQSDAVVYFSTAKLTSSNFRKGSLNSPVFTDAGNYRVYYYVHSGNYDPHPVKGYKNVRITKAPLTVKAKSNTIARGERAVGSGVTYSGFVAGETESHLAGKVSWTSTYPKGGTPGIYHVTPKGLKSRNYAIKYLPGNLYVVENNKIESDLLLKQENGAATLTWGRVACADGYDVFFQYCGTPFTKKATRVLKNQTQTSVTSLNGEPIDASACIKAYAAAYQKINGKKVYISTSVILHSAGQDHPRFTNPAGLSLDGYAVHTRVNQSTKVKPSITIADRSKELLNEDHAVKYRYASSNTKVATVNANGMITAVGKGTCTIYAIAMNGHVRKIKVTVK